MMILHKTLLTFLVAFHILGPSWVLAIQTTEALSQKSVKSLALISGIHGVVTVIPKNKPGYAPEYQTVLNIDDVISTDEESLAEILLQNQGLVTLQDYSEAMVVENDHGKVSLALEAGAAEWSIPHQKSEGVPFTFMTPNARVTSQGGLLRAKVQRIFSELVQTPQSESSFLVRTSFQTKSASVANTDLLERFCVNEGSLTINLSGGQQETLAPGECRGFLNGQPYAKKTIFTIDELGAVCVVGSHCEIPESAKKLIITKQTGQALALEQALVGSDQDKVEVDERVILATTGLLLVADTQNVGPENPDTGGVVLPCTGDSCDDPGSDGTGTGDGVGTGDGSGTGDGTGDGSGSGDGSGTGDGTGDGAGSGDGSGTGDGTGDGSGSGDGSGNGVGSEPGDGSGSGSGGSGGGTTPEPNVGGMEPVVPPVNTGGNSDGGLLPPEFPSNIQTITELLSASGVEGGIGLLNFQNGDFTADKELFLADSGLLASAPHLGKPPQNPLVVDDLSPDGVGSPSNQNVTLEFSSFTVNRPNLPPLNSRVQLGVEGTSRFQQSQQLSQFARSSSIDPDDIFSSLAGTGNRPPSQLSRFEILLSDGLGGFENPPNPDPDAGIDASIQVRSPSTMDSASTSSRFVTVKKGVVLTNTQVTLAPQVKTTTSFSGLNPDLGQSIQAAAVSIVGEPGDPAQIKVEDRILAILGGSHIQSADPTVTTALLSVLDGTLQGPNVPSVIGRDTSGADILRDGVSPIIEVIDGSADVTNAVVVGSTANPNQTEILDEALLEACAPLLSMIRGNLTTSSNFARVAGQNAKLNAMLLPGDALVRLNASSLVVNGNLFNVTGGAQLNVIDGSILSVQGGSMVDINGGVFVNVGAGSLFSLTNGALVDFGMGNNVVNISNDLCAGGGCFQPFANPAWQVAGSPSDFSAPNNFNPFEDLGTFADGSINSLNVGQDSAILSVESGGSIQIQ